MYVFGPPVWERVPVEARKGCRIPCSWIYRRLCAELPSMDAENLTLVLCKISKCSHVPHRLPNPMELRVKGSFHLCAYLFVCRCTQCTPLWRAGDNLSCHSSNAARLGFWDTVSPLRDICLTGWPVSLRDLPVLTASALGLRHIPLSFFYVSSRLNVRHSCLSGKKFTDRSASPAPSLRSYTAFCEIWEMMISSHPMPVPSFSQ